jgi:hypothetical protein
MNIFGFKMDLLTYYYKIELKIVCSILKFKYYSFFKKKIHRKRLQELHIVLHMLKNTIITFVALLFLGCAL